MTETITEQQATVTSKGQVTIPVAMRRALGLAEGGAVLFSLKDGVVTMKSARKVTLSELLAGYDPARHRHGAEERVWDDSPRGRESL